jgi:serine/threonine protein kinase
MRKKKHAHPHLITLLATYEQNDSLYLILPWAEADLDEYWNLRFPMPSNNDLELSTWIKQQCSGMAEAVSQIHRYRTSSDTSIRYNITLSPPEVNDTRDCSHLRYDLGQQTPMILFGRHGDIKPANILWFPDRDSANGLGKLKISDFGTARFSDNEKITVRNKTTVQNSRPYQSPESILPGGEISSQCDVWALGCVFLEFVCWYYGGRELLKQFEFERGYACESPSFFLINVEETPRLVFAKLKQPVVKVS